PPPPRRLALPRLQGLAAQGGGPHRHSQSRALEHRHARHPPARNRSLSVTEDVARDTRPAILGRVVVFVRGSRPPGEAGLAEARELYPTHDFVFVTEPQCRGWLGTHPRDLV